MPFHYPARLAAVLLSCCAVLAPPEAVLASAQCWPPPVHGEVVDRFRPPPCPYCAGNRGLEYETAAPAAVRASAAGVVTFSGSVAGVNYVVVELPNGWRLTYGRAAEVLVGRGQRVFTGSPLAVASGGLFLGLRVGNEYRDPSPYLGELVGVPRLIPADGSEPRPAPPARLSCRSGTVPASSR